MKPKSLLLILLVMVFASCMKEHSIEPVQTDLTGMWAARDNSITFVINNTRGEGFNVKFTDIKKSDGRYLKVEMPTINEVYKITQLTGKDMVLLDSHAIATGFDKIK